MYNNVLKTKDYTKMLIKYVNEKGLTKKQQVNVRYVDLETCYLAMPLPSIIEKPKRKSKAEIIVYTADGVYNSEVTVLSTEVTLREFFYEVSLPKAWNYKQLRNGTRKKVELPLTLKFDDNFEISAKSMDLSVTGVSFKLEQSIPTMYHRLMCKMTLQLPNESYVKFPEAKFVCDANFVRLKEDYEYNENLYVFRFKNVSKEDTATLQNYLLHLI